MLCPVCNINRFLKDDIDAIEADGYCTTCNSMEKFFTNDETITKAEANAHGLRVIDESWFGKQQEEE